SSRGGHTRSKRDWSSDVCSSDLDTLELSRLVNPEYKSHRLNTLAKRYNVQLERHHRAVYDSETTGYILMKLLEQAKDQFGIVNQIGRASCRERECGSGEAV